jgi:hypothetical protein
MFQILYQKSINVKLLKANALLALKMMFYKVNNKNIAK